MQNLNVNITPDNYPQSLYYSQNDVGREFKINITDFTIPVGATVKIQATKPSGFGFSVAGTVSGNSVTFETTDEMTDEAGRFPAELVIESGAVVIGTANFLMVGEMNPHPEGTTDGSQGTIIPELTLLVERVEAAASSILDMQVVAQTLPAGSQASYSYDEDLNKATFGIPEGQAGAGAAGVVASAYSAAKTYKVGDYVLYNSNLYRCTTAITTAEAWTAAHWTQIVLADDVTDLKTDLQNNIGERLTKVDGIIVPTMEKGGIAFSSSSVAYQALTNAIRTPQNSTLTVHKGDVIGLTDYTTAKFKVAIMYEEGHYSYQNFMTADFTANIDGVLLLDVRYIDDSDVTNVGELQSLIRINKHTGDLHDINDELEIINNYQEILETSTFPKEYMGVGEYGSGTYFPVSQGGRKYRIATIKTLTFDFDITLKPKTGFRVYCSAYINGSWVNGWQTTSYTFKANTPFGFQIARVTEDTSETADVDTFLANCIATTNFSDKVYEIENQLGANADEDAIEEFMARFYASEQAEAYAFFTDPHLMGTNGTFSESTFNSYIKVLEDTVKRTSASYVVCGGDWLNNGDTKDEASVKLGYVDGRMKSIFPNRYFPMVGNHDYNYLGVDSGGTRLTEANWITRDALHNFWFAEYPNSTYYKFKKALALNYVLNTEMDYDSIDAVTKAQIKWFGDELTTDNPTHATVFLHIIYLSAVGTTVPKKVEAIGKIIEAFNDHTTLTLTDEELDGQGTLSFDFTSTTGHIDYCVAGHSHADFTTTLGGVPVIGCINFQSGGVPSFDLVFADYTNSKVYTTRVGSGSSRSFNI